MLVIKEINMLSEMKHGMLNMELSWDKGIHKPHKAYNSPKFQSTP